MFLGNSFSTLFILLTCSGSFRSLCVLPAWSLSLCHWRVEHNQVIADEYSGAVLCPIRSMMRDCMVASMLWRVSVMMCALKVRSFPQVNGQGLLSTYNATRSPSLAFFWSHLGTQRHTRTPRERERDTANVIRNLSVVLSRVHLSPLLSSLSLSSCGTVLMLLQERIELSFKLLKQI